ncbi:hypothetical protein EQV77_03450 [Halobacillus fulvus]|nr:hypothetical protein EQV77_03450 [Halobacillus fulvus]
MRKSRKRVLTDEEIINLYNKGLSTKEISSRANVTDRSIRNVLSGNKIEMRKRGSWIRKYEINEDYFKSWTNNMAYILGFFAADGVINNAVQTVSIAQNEIEILLRIRDELNSKHKIYKNKKTGVYQLNINSIIIKEDLMTLHFLSPNKSFNLKMPLVPKQYQSHFFRGYFDGDGCIYKNKRFVNITCGSQSFIEDLNLLLSSHEINSRIKSCNNYYRLYVSGLDTEKLFRWMYKDKDLYLERKYKIFTSNFKDGDGKGIL